MSQTTRQQIVAGWMGMAGSNLDMVGTMQVAAPGEVTDLIDQLRAAAAVLTYDPDMHDTRRRQRHGHRHYRPEPLTAPERQH